MVDCLMNMPVIGCDLEDIEFLATGWHCYKLGYQYYKNKLLAESSKDLALMKPKSLGKKYQCTAWIECKKS